MITKMRRVSDQDPCFITFEAGPTHDGLESAKLLADHTARAGADAIKFQILDPERLVADKKQPFSYEILVDKKTGQRETVTEPLYDILMRRSLTRAEWRDLKKHCDELNLAFFATVSFADEIDFLEELNCHSIKIASGDVDHVPLLRRAAKSGMCLQLDTGNATLGEIEFAVDVIVDAGCKDIIIHQCPSGYPAHLESINLNIIPTLKRMFPYAVAFSDHTPGWEMDIAAVALGANLVEKTISLDRMTPSVEHIMSLEPDDMENFVKAIRDLEIALGHQRRLMTADEREKRKAIRRSAFVAHDLPSGYVLTSDDIEFRRPGFGVGPIEIDRIVGKMTIHEMKSGDPITWAGLKD